MQWYQHAGKCRLSSHCSKVATSSFQESSRATCCNSFGKLCSIWTVTQHFGGRVQVQCPDICYSWSVCCYIASAVSQAAASQAAADAGSSKTTTAADRAPDSMQRTCCHVTCLSSQQWLYAMQGVAAVAVGTCWGPATLAPLLMLSFGTRALSELSAWPAAAAYCFCCSSENEAYAVVASS